MGVGNKRHQPKQTSNMTPEIKLGDRVSVPEESSPATVAEICEDGTVSLIFDDGEQGYYWPADLEKI